MVDLGSPRPVWRIPPDRVTAIRRALGRGWVVVNVGSPAPSDGDGAVGSDEAVGQAVGAELYFGWGVPGAVARAAAGTLRWAHTAAGGVRATLGPEFRATGAVLTNSRGVYAEPMADWAVAAITFCLRGFHAAVQAQREHRWAKNGYTGSVASVREFSQARVGVLGLGGVGRAVARRCSALGMEVRGTRRRSRGRRPRGVLWVGGPADAVRLARESDVLVVALPHTVETEAVVDDRVLRALPSGGFLVNLSRGAVVDEKALLHHLESHHLGGCVLDVFQVEPLPQDHPLWDHPGVLVTPHVSGVSTRFWEREMALILDNIGRYREGRRLRNIVRPDIGY